MRTAKVCTIVDCNAKHYGKGLCNKHYMRKRLNLPAITKFDRRKSIINGEVAKIPIGVNAKHGYAIVDVSYSWLDKFNWCNDRDGYVLSKVNGRLTRMHHMITGIPSEGLEIDHINHIRHDNRISNLRTVTHTQNMANLARKVINA